MTDASIVWNRAKIEAPIHNARLLTAQSLADLGRDINRSNTIGCARGLTAAWTPRCHANSQAI